MRVVFLKSVRREGGERAQDDYAQNFDTLYADRVIGNLVGADDFCSSCGPECIRCRRPYGREFSSEIAQVVELPSVLPYVLEEPGSLLPERVESHDVLIAVAVHEQILLEALTRCPDWGTRGVVVPLEAPGWVSGATMARAREICESRGVEIAFPKPFCTLDPPDGGLLAEFVEHFHIGRPKVDFTTEDGVIRAANVTTSAPCGATYYIARWLVGKRLDEDLKYGVVSKRLHSYPCTASMEWDNEIGDTVLHLSGKAHYAILGDLGEPEEEDRVFVTPTGIVMTEPVPFGENQKDLEDARQAILDELRARTAAPVDVLQNLKGIKRATVLSALLLLKKEGVVEIEGRSAHLAHSVPGSARNA